MKDVRFTSRAFNDLSELKALDKKLVFKALDLVENAKRTPFKGLGKPEALKHSLSGYWSRRISEEHRLVYRIVGDDIEIHSCFGHYSE
jgi:toxin YoeB